ncbi:amidase [Streptomyces sp. NPDC046900]|uniref:amidase n=1 Tax=Streptomyces sp. NPDC046900 TaxID=3155473 RepID=UPI0033F33BC1
MHDEIAYLSAHELRTAYTRRELSPVEVVRALGDRIQALDAFLNTMTATSLERALQAAQASEQRYREGRPLPLDGVSVAVKDLIDTADLQTTYGSGMFAGHLPHRDAPVVRLVRAAGGVVIGKSATHEFAWGITTDNEHFGPTRNPWAPDRVPGGSSGGSAAALAAGLAPLALGTDTAGSIRIPAAFCGVVGLKPTHGAVDGRGVFPLAPSLDHVGPMARTVSDVRLLHSVISKPDYRLHRGAPDPSSLAIKGLRVGICPDLDQIPLGSAAQAARDATAAAFTELGAQVVEVPAPDAPRLYETLGAVVLAEGSRVHRRAGLWPGRGAEYGQEVRSRLELAAIADADTYVDSHYERVRLHSVMHQILSAVDVLLSPVSAISPVPIGQDKLRHAGRQLPFRELVMTSTAPQSLTGLPACTVRAGFDEHGLPVGVQLTSPPRTESRLLDIAEHLHRATEALQNRWPAVTMGRQRRCPPGGEASRTDAPDAPYRATWRSPIPPATGALPRGSH